MPPAEVSAWADAYVGIPWQWRGRDREGIDCYGLLVLVYREQRGITLPEYPYSTHSAAAATIAEEARRWCRVSTPAPFDVAIVDATRWGAAGVAVHGPFHLALHAGGACALHTMEAPGVVLVPTSRLRLQGWYRHVRP